MRHWDFLLVARAECNGYVLMNADEEEGEKHLRAILHSSFRHDEERVKNLILGVSEDWLKERVVETKEFIERIK